LAATSTGLFRLRRISAKIRPAASGLRGRRTPAGDVGFLDRQLGLGAHARLQALVGDVLEAGGVDQLQVQVAQAAVGEAAVAGDAGLVVDQGQLAPARRLNRVDLPTLGRPTMASFKGMGCD
jgi:hypothetical protein